MLFIVGVVDAGVGAFSICATSTGCTQDTVAFFDAIASFTICATCSMVKGAVPFGRLSLSKS